ncbi:acyl carrier protein [Plesiomonas shigelloides]|nr:acyl carrier protein [Plesiomonas shigelloides]
MNLHYQYIGYVVRKVILEKFNEALEQTDVEQRHEDIRDDQVLLESGLDSLGFAILVALLEEELDLDPFQQMEEPVYPTTFGEFVAIYEKYSA